MLELDDDGIELETEQSTLHSIDETAAEAMQKHKLLKLDSRVWVCADPETSFYSFYVAELPGAIALWGDIGSLMVDAGTAYNIDWLQKAVRSPYYLLEKCSLAKKTHYYSGDFREYVKGHSPESEWSDWSEHGFHDYLRETGDSEAYDVVYGYTRASFWGIQGFKKFIDLLGATK